MTRARLLRRAAACAALTCLVAGGAPSAAAESPDWVEGARKLPLPASAAKSDVVVLLEEMQIDVSRSERKERVRQVVRINKDGGLGHPLSAAQRIGEDFKLAGGWKVRPDGAATSYDRKSIIQVDADGSYEFSMSKVNTFRPDELHVGDVLAWEYVSRYKPESYVTNWVFGDSSPTLVSRFGIRLPPDWTMRQHLLRVTDLPATRDDDGYMVWEMRDLQALPDEPLQPPVLDLLPQLLIVYSPPDRGPDDRRRESWEDLARWYAGIASPQIVSDGVLKKTAADLAGGTGDIIQRVRAITKFTQSLRYLNTAIGRSVAEPHPAPQVLKNRFGDCEDKAILTIAMLREIGVEAYPVIARTRSAGSVQPDFPGVDLFNHVVLAMRLPPETPPLPASVDAGALGALVVFNPTDSDTGFGDLPGYLQGTQALITHSDKGRLVGLPSLDPALSSRAADVDLSLDAAGQMQVRAHVVHEGQYAARERYHYGVVRAEKRREEVATRLGRHYGKVEVRRLDVTGVENPSDPVDVQLELSMKPPGREVGSMRILHLMFLLPTLAETLPGGARTTPLAIDQGYREAEISRLPLPAGVTIGSKLPAVDLSSAAGTYRLAARVEDGVLVTERELVVRPITVEPAGYADIKRFFDDVATADGMTVILQKGK